MTRLVIFDVDGTLVDSQAMIIATMSRAFESAGLEVPGREAVLGIVGLSLEQAVWRLAPAHHAALRARVVDGYRRAFSERRMAEGAAIGSPLFPGAREALEALANAPDTLLAVATGKSRRGLDALLSDHGLAGFFVTTQVADDHPSKPHPSMLEAALAATGCVAADAAMIGDTSYDMEMAASAGIPGIAVTWGYHTPEALRPHARRLIDGFGELPEALAGVWA